ncbi:MAG: SGNH/GDSL hydrolase family protein [Alphaproteobacteria bacterium]|nr:SGNH/GDSL hydrolase family protein [Alphaproteobacteria bacterium]
MLLAAAIVAPAARAADACYVEPAQLLESPHRLERTARLVAAGELVRIVALGSSSTEGVGASDYGHAYPAQTQAALAGLLPRSHVIVFNKGIGGQEAREMVDRLAADVLAEKPDLVIWQVGTNSLIRSKDLQTLVDDIFAGVRRIQAAGVDVMLMGPQKSPRVDGKQERTMFAQHLQVIAETARIPYFARYEIMAGWIARRQMTMDQMIDPDGLHMTDLSYRCLGAAVAQMIVNLTRAPLARQ